MFPDWIFGLSTLLLLKSLISCGLIHDLIYNSFCHTFSRGLFEIFFSWVDQLGIISSRFNVVSTNIPEIYRFYYWFFSFAFHKSLFTIFVWIFYEGRFSFNFRCLNLLLESLVVDVYVDFNGFFKLMNRIYVTLCSNIWCIGRYCSRLKKIWYVVHIHKLFSWSVCDFINFNRFSSQILF